LTSVDIADYRESTLIDVCRFGGLSDEFGAA